MQQHALGLTALVCAWLFGHAPGDVVLVSPSPEALCQDWFGPSAQLSPLTLVETNAVVSEVTLDGQTSGWVFRTDQIPPACKGKRGEIVLLVAVGADARIKGLSVLSHKEDPTYFKRLKTGFFDQFKNLRADGESVKIDAVTKATLSSKAIIREVMEGAKIVVSQPEVASKISASSQSPLTKTAAMSHN